MGRNPPPPSAFAHAAGYGARREVVFWLFLRRMQLDLDQLNRPLIVRRWRTMLWSMGALASLGVVGSVALWVGWGSRAPSALVIAALVLASGGLAQFLALLLISSHRRKQLVAAGHDVCPSCRWSGVLGPADQSCPSCGSPRGCAVCGQRLFVGQCACPECGRAVWGRSRPYLNLTRRDTK